VTRSSRDVPPAAPGLEGLAARWRAEAELLRAHGAVEAAATKGHDAGELETAWRAWHTAELTVSEGAAESGYSADRLRELVREGRLAGRQAADGVLRVRRCDLPRRPGVPAPAGPVAALAAAVLAGRR